MTALPDHSAPIDEPIRRGGEGADQGRDPVSGALIYRLTSGPPMNHLIYCEQPYTSPDGKRVAVIRSSDFSFGTSYALLVAEPDTLGVTLVERAIPGDIAHNAWGEWLYYKTHEGALRRVSLLTLAKEPVLPDGAIPPDSGGFASITPDNTTIFLEDLRPGVDTPDRRIVTLDTRTGARRTIFTHIDNVNGHLQCEPTRGRLVLMQLVVRRPGQAYGVPVQTMNADGSNVQRLPIGAPHTAESSGHMAWITGQERIACALGWDTAHHRHDGRHPQGNIAIAGPGDSRPTVFAAPEHAAYHVSVSRCGRYFIADDFMDFRADLFGHSGTQAPIRVIVGNFTSGKSRVLVNDCQSRGIAGSSRWEPDPYMTADNRFVLFNASPFGINQVFAAKVPEGFLASLD